MIEWLCTQERWNQEIGIIFDTAARYGRVAVGNNYDEARPDNFTLRTGAVRDRPHPGFVRSLFFIAPRNGNRRSKRCQLFLVYRWRALLRGMFVSRAYAFRAGGDAYIFSVGPSGSRRGVISGD